MFDDIISAGADVVISLYSIRKKFSGPIDLPENDEVKTVSVPSPTCQPVRETVSLLLLYNSIYSKFEPAAPAQPISFITTHSFLE